MVVHQLGDHLLLVSLVVSWPVSCWWLLLWLGHLDFVGIPSIAIRPLPRAFIAFRTTCMSHTPPTDYDVVDLALDFADLSISIRGPPSSAAAFVRNLSATSSDISSVALPSQAIANLVTLWLLHLRPRKLQRLQLDRRVAPALHPPFHLFLRVGFVLLLAWVSRTYQQKDGYVELGQQGVGLELWLREGLEAQIVPQLAVWQTDTGLWCGARGSRPL